MFAARYGKIDKKQSKEYNCITSNTMKVINMSTISLRVNEEESKLIRDYVTANNLNLSQFIREAVLDKIEEDFQLDEERILLAKAKAQTEKKYDHTEVWEILGI
ncbi:type II toxin-antitoxin system RelB family antitoxin [Enterococcus columbae]|nr:DUF6290 family protein [Enterococcus columbae]OJG26293.1 hypothetical protein RR47_GL000041 [Enterococcus columbae DSM 7374 = ATCC 51263]OJG26299.1 hypothetical protein RR47_GL000047 [Enterococcus columbae DSM 7374 = ATCC 51263]